MSLRVWLPLRGNLDNQGLADITVTNSGATVNAAGKIGSCYYFDGTDDFINLGNIGEYFDGSAFSICFWIKSLENGTRGCVFTSYGLSSTSNFFSLEINSGSVTNNSLRFDWKGADIFYSNADDISYNEWAHICVTYDGINTLKTYKNGSLVYTKTYTLSTITTGNNYYLGRDSRTGSTAFNGYLNDFRLYDHALSTKEVEEIAQGLVLHYKLDNTLEIDNIIYDSSGYNNNGTIINSITTSNSSPRYNTSAVFDGSSSCIKVTDNNWLSQGMQAMTINLWAKSSSWTNAHLFSCTESGGFNTESGNSGYLRFPVHVYTDSAQSSTAYKFDSQEIQISSLSTTEWNMLTFVYDITGTKTYINGELHHTYTNTSYGIHFNTNARLFLGCEASGANPTTPYFNGQESDFRIYTTALTAENIKNLYNTGMSIDNKQNIHIFELNEQNNNLFAGIPWTTSYGSHSKLTSLFKNYNDNGEPQFTANSTSAGSDYIEITPGIYEYDYTISVNTGNQFHIGFERYDENKTSRTNAACVYTTSIKPSSDIVKQRYKGTVTLTTDGTNTIKYISLRILNGWSGTTSGVTGTATIHNFSLRLQSDAINPQLKKIGQFMVDEFKEDNQASFYKNHIVEANHFIER